MTLRTECQNDALVVQTAIRLGSPNCTRNVQKSNTLLVIARSERKASYVAISLYAQKRSVGEIALP